MKRDRNWWKIDFWRKIEKIDENLSWKRILIGSIVAPMRGLRIIPYPEWERKILKFSKEKYLEKESWSEKNFKWKIKGGKRIIFKIKDKRKTRVWKLEFFEGFVPTRVLDPRIEKNSKLQTKDKRGERIGKDLQEKSNRFDENWGRWWKWFRIIPYPEGKRNKIDKIDKRLIKKSWSQKNW